MDLSSIDRFMAIGAHCDDVDIRMGGTFARLVREGKQGCYVVAVENAYVGPHFVVDSAREALQIRRRESTEAAGILGADRLEWLRFKSYYLSEPDRTVVYPLFESQEAMREQLEDVILEGLPPVSMAYAAPECVERVTSLIDDFAPDVVFTHYPDDRHPDHYNLSRFLSLLWEDSEREGGCEYDVVFWEPGSGGPLARFRPNLFVELSEEDVETKDRALNCYWSQFPESTRKGYAAQRAGTYGEVIDVPYAEAFFEGVSPRMGEPDCELIRSLAEEPAGWEPAVWRL